MKEILFVSMFLNTCGAPPQPLPPLPALTPLTRAAAPTAAPATVTEPSPRHFTPDTLPPPPQGLVLEI